MSKIIFAMYNPETDCVEVSLDDEIHVSFNCQKCNASVRLNEPSDIAYLTRLAREEPGLYAKLASRDGGLQGYVRIGLLRCYDSVVANAASDGYVIGLWDRGP